jgi:hypothetical protein
MTECPAGMQHSVLSHGASGGRVDSCFSVLIVCAGRFGAVPPLIDANCSGPCTAGYYCLQQSVIPAQFECGGVGFYCPTGSSGPRSVPAGSYSIGGSVFQLRE